MPPESFSTSENSDVESIISIKKRRRSSTGPKYACSHCGATFFRQHRLDQHEYHHNGIKKHGCTYKDCKKFYTTLAHLKRHVLSSHERKQPPPKDICCTVKDCYKLFPSYTNMQRHIREVHQNPKIYNCHHCDEKFTQKLRMRRHEIANHTGDYPFKCDKCSKGFYQKYNFERHLPVCKIYPCPNCDLKFDKWTIYLKHCRETQHGRKYYKCESCDRNYSKPSELQKHMSAKHSTEELMVNNYKCTHEGCNRAYAYERNLKQHMKTAHLGERFICEVENCDRLFSSAQNLTKHLEREHKGKFFAKSTAAAAAKVEVKELPKVEKKRKKRKDAGETTVSLLATVSGIEVDKSFDKLLRSRDDAALELAMDILTKETESDEGKNLM